MNEISYYIFYLKRNNSIYAFTTEKEEALKFMKLRKNDIFIRKKRILTIEERKDFLESYSSNRMKEYIFYLKNIKLSIMLTYKEYLHIEGLNVKESIIMKSYSIINPNIFNKKYFKSLYDIGYIKSWMTWEYGTEDEYSDNKLFELFMQEYSNTISLNKLRKELIKCVYI